MLCVAESFYCFRFSFWLLARAATRQGFSRKIRNGERVGSHLACVPLRNFPVRWRTFSLSIILLHISQAARAALSFSSAAWLGLFSLCVKFNFPFATHSVHVANWGFSFSLFLPAITTLSISPPLDIKIFIQPATRLHFCIYLRSEGSGKRKPLQCVSTL